MKIVVILSILSALMWADGIKISDENATDPIYQIPLKKYPKWICQAELTNGKKVEFVSVKSMMQVYEHQPYFIKHKFMDDNISKLYVQDYLNGRVVDAKKAQYVFGSHLVGPHGDDLVPFESESSAKIFMLKHGGTKMLPFKRLTKGLIRYLDM